LRASEVQRRALLQGLMDMDGTVDRCLGKASWCTTSPVLRDGFLELLATLGVKSVASHKVAKIGGRVIGDAWNVHFTADFPLFRLQRKACLLRTGKRRGVHKRRYIEAVRPVPSVPVRCIAVDAPSHLFLAGRSMIPTHNSTIAARIALGQARQRRRVLYGAWEMSAEETSELMAVMSLAEENVCVSRRQLQIGASEEMICAVEARAKEIDKVVRYIPNPFQHSGKETNGENLDIVQHLIEDSGADVFIADLWDRCLVDDSPSEIQQALWRQQAICEGTKCHGILLQQQRLKDVEVRADKRPTREGIKGTSAWVDVADTILGVYRPAQWKNVPDDMIVVDVLKQRYAPWPLSVELEWNPDLAWFGRGTSVPYDRPSEREGPDAMDSFSGGGKKSKRHHG
jgi:hypothetical protein